MTAVGMEIKDQAESSYDYRIEGTDRIWMEPAGQRIERKRGLGWLRILSGALAALELGGRVRWMSSDLDLVSRRRWQVKCGGGGAGCDHQLATLQQDLGHIWYQVTSTRFL